MSDKPQLPTKDEILQSLTTVRLRPGLDLSKQFEKARDQFYPERPRQPSPEFALLVTVEKGKKPLAGARLSWTTSGDSQSVVDSNPSTNDAGKACTVFSSETLHGHSNLTLSVESPDKEPTLSAVVRLGISGTQRFISEDGVTVTVSPPKDYLDESLERRSGKRRRVPIGLCGSRKQIGKVLPYLTSQRCLSVRSVFLKNSRKGRGDLKLPKSVKTFALDKNIEDQLGGIRFLIDFSASRHVRALHKKRVMGKAAEGPLVLLGSEVFLDDLAALVGQIESSVGALT